MNADPSPDAEEGSDLHRVLEPEEQPSFVDSFTSGLRRNSLLYVVLIVMVMTLAAFWVAISGITANREQNTQLSTQVQCQNRYNQINNERTRQLAAATDAEREAEDVSDKALAAFVRAIEKGSPKAEQIVLLRALNTALARQEQKRAETELERKEHPVPPPPEALCPAPGAIAGSN